MFPSSRGKVKRIVPMNARGNRVIESVSHFAKSSTKDFHSIEQFLSNKTLIFTTVHQLRKNSLLSKKMFDYVIVNEAAKVFEPILVECLFFAKKALFFNDPLLNPQNPYHHIAKPDPTPEKIMIERLMAKYKESVFWLDTQYRMPTELTNFYNFLISGNPTQIKLKAGQPRLKPITLFHLPHTPIFTSKILSEAQWVKDILIKPSNVIFLDTNKFQDWTQENPSVLQYIDRENEVRKNLDIYELGSGRLESGLQRADSGNFIGELGLYTSENRAEDLTVFLGSKLLFLGFPAERMGVVRTGERGSTYLELKLGNNDVQVRGVRGCSGMDKDVVFLILDYGFFEQGEGREVFELLALVVSRAERKLVVVGSLEE